MGFKKAMEKRKREQEGVINWKLHVSSPALNALCCKQPHCHWWPVHFFNDEDLAYCPHCSRTGLDPIPYSEMKKT